ncbi:TIGR02444 family protein [Alteromonas flava]|uniref:TIGR02444 family protein n=1 Tax=Alteromonas flava TaxID=2048003 RepID=UPI000C28A440|nr:TIGR02444 family protein [Alteromonas flava]
MLIDRLSAWNYALQLYAFPSVACDLIQLQDEFDCNVNVLLFCQYLDSLRADVYGLEFAELEGLLEPSSQTIAAHRQKRRIAKHKQPESYQLLKQQELELEQLQHRSLVAIVNQYVDQKGQVASEHGEREPILMTYLAYCQVPLHQRQRLASLMKTANQGLRSESESH